MGRFVVQNKKMEIVSTGDNPFKLMGCVKRDNDLTLYEKQNSDSVKIVEQNGVLYRELENQLYQLTKKK